MSENTNPQTPEQEGQEAAPRQKTKFSARDKKVLVYVGCGIAFLVIAYFLLTGSSANLNVAAPNSAKKSNPERQKIGEGSEMTKEALEDVKKQLEGSKGGNPNGVVTPSPSGTSSNPGTTFPEGSGSVTVQPDPAKKEKTDGSSSTALSGSNPPAGSSPSEKVGSSNVYAGYRAISYADRPVADPPVPSESRPASVSSSPISKPPARFSPPIPSRPPLGSLLPVTLLGGLSTIVDNGIVRFQLQREVGGRNWKLSQGTIFIGRVSGSDQNRGYVRIIGYLTENDELVPLSATLTGSDGFPGLVGERRRLDSRWASIFSKLANAGLSLGQSVLISRSRGGVFVPVSSLPQDIFSSEVATLQPTARKKEFVQVLAGANGYLLVDQLPEAKTIDTLPSSAPSDSQTITEAELAELVENFDPDRIRRAIPRMPPQIRSLFERALQLDEEGRRLEAGK